MAYEGFKKVEASVAQEPGVRDPGAVTAAIGRKKYGAKKFNDHAAKGETLESVEALKK